VPKRLFIFFGCQQSSFHFKISFMSNNPGTVSNPQLTAENIISWFFGIVFFGIGLINMFWGNDLWYGVFIVLLSFIYFLPVNTIVAKLTGLTIPKMGLVKILIGLFIFWSALGVGELLAKIEMMQQGAR
jgi:hypothetical protein